MPDTGDLLVKGMSEKKNFIRIDFRYPIIFDHVKIVDILTRKRSEPTNIQNVTLDNVTLTIGGYDTAYGFQYTIVGIENPNAGKRVFRDGNEYPIQLENEEMISELRFSFFEKDKKFRMRFVGNLIEIRPKPSPLVVKEIVYLLKKNLMSNPEIFLLSAREKLRSAKVDFLSGRYRSVIHNLYYSMYNAVRSLQAKEGKEESLEHKKVGKTLDRILSEIQQGTSTLKVCGETEFGKLNRDEHVSVVEEVRDLRELADYRVGFEVGVIQEQLAEMLSKAEELVTITDYIVNNWMIEENGKIVLHSPREEVEFSLPDDLLNLKDLEEDVLMESLLVLTDEFNATVFAYRLLSENDIYSTELKPSFFGGGKYAKYEKGTYFHQRFPEEGFIELTRETVKKWSEIIKPHKLEDLGTCKENLTQKLCLFLNNCFLEIYVIPDGRIYILSPLDESFFRIQLETFRNIEKVIMKIISKKWPEHSILFSKVAILRKKKDIPQGIM